jgi:hypothetical protein
MLTNQSNIIVRAEKEVFLATNYWQASGASKFITDGMIELNRRAKARDQKIVFKLMYDRGNLKQVSLSRIPKISTNTLRFSKTTNQLRSQTIQARKLKSPIQKISHSSIFKSSITIAQH